MKKFAIMVVAFIMAMTGVAFAVPGDGWIWESEFSQEGELIYSSYPLGQEMIKGGICESRDFLNPDFSLILEGGESWGRSMQYTGIGDTWEARFIEYPQGWQFYGATCIHALRRVEPMDDGSTIVHYTRFYEGKLSGNNEYIPSDMDLDVDIVIMNDVRTYLNGTVSYSEITWGGKVKGYSYDGISYAVDMNLGLLLKETWVNFAEMTFNAKSIPQIATLITRMDTDGDGIADVIEGGDDINQDGILDKNQPNIVKIVSEGIPISLIVDPSVTFRTIYSVNRDRLPDLPEEFSGKDYTPLDTVNFAINTEIGERVEINIILPEGVNPSGFIKYGSTQDNPQAHYFELPPPSMNGPYAEILPPGNHIRLFLVDGGIGDIDGIENGVIIDPFTLTFAAPPLIAPANITAEYEGGSGQVVDIGEAICGDPNAIVTNDAPDVFPYGQTTVVWTATSETGATTVVEQTITVVDTIAPSVTTPTSLIGKSGVYLIFSPIQGEDLSGVTKVLSKVTLSFWGLNLTITPLAKFVVNDLWIPASFLQIMGGTVNLTWELSDSHGNKMTTVESISIPKR